MKHDLLKDFNLPASLKNKSFAEASKRIKKMFEGRNDKASLDTKQEFLERLAAAQEHKKEIEGIEDTNSKEMGGLTIASTALSMLPNALNLGKQGLDIITGKSRREADRLADDTGMQLSAEYGQSDFGKGGYTNKYNWGSFVTKAGEVAKDQPQAEEDQSFLGKTANWLGENFGSIARVAPLVGNLTNKLDRPVTPRGTRLTNTYTPQLFDEARLTNLINRNNVDSALKESSTGDAGALRSNLIAANLGKIKALSDGYSQAFANNQGEQKFKFSNEMSKDQINAELDRDFLNRSAMDQGAYETARQAQRSALFEDIGKIGKEEAYKRMVREMFGYKWNGKYWVDKKGNQIEDSVVRSNIQKMNQ